ncbi:formate/nitrite transporter family protein [Halopelagius longus]|uniref:Formate/nitrite transporter FocA, FNT family n=1 Tax=Halopelagius longus TaxID=1236180 RepID=A0A1H1ECB5_9EURY|nr:formate/nitrite transporter family protein [Halopelagius longus]RDI71696.1 formate/nitrite transporter family protein [Halopelagius longus]SDQ86397.1 Formate/nitrite transporter FocA, FNT family [Halopelagius longus]
MSDPREERAEELAEEADATEAVKEAQAEAKNRGEQTPERAILEEQITNAMNELRRPASGLFLSAFSAGLDIGFGPLLMAAVFTLVSEAWSDPLTSIVLANLYSVGFIFVVLGRSELFTEHTTLAVLPVLDGRASISDLGHLWGVVYVGNVVGGVIFASIAVTVGPEFGIADTAAFVELARGLTQHSLWGLMTAAVLAGWLMGLLSWLVAAAQETISRTFFVWLIATTIGLAHLPHCIAGNVEVLMGLLAGSEVGFFAYGRFLAVSTVGNAVGGSVFVALLKYGHVVRGGPGV